MTVSSSSIVNVAAVDISSPPTLAVSARSASAARNSGADLFATLFAGLLEGETRIAADVPEANEEGAEETTRGKGTRLEELPGKDKDKEKAGQSKAGNADGPFWQQPQVPLPEAEAAPLTFLFTGRLNPQPVEPAPEEHTESAAVAAVTPSASGGQNPAAPPRLERSTAVAGSMPSLPPPPAPKEARAASLSIPVANREQVAEPLPLAFAAWVEEHAGNRDADRKSGSGNDAKLTRPEVLGPDAAFAQSPEAVAAPAAARRIEGETPRTALTPVVPAEEAKSMRPVPPAVRAPVEPAEEAKNMPPAARTSPGVHEMTTILAPAAASRAEGSVQTAAPQPSEPPLSTRPQEAPGDVRQPGPSTHGISLSLGEPGRERVEVQLRERQGAIQVSVRTADSGLTSSLRGELNDLVTRLESRGYHAETWAPTETAVVRAPAAEGSQPQQRDPEQGGSSAGGGDSQRHPSSGGDRRDREEQRPHWLEEWESSTPERGRNR